MRVLVAGGGPAGLYSALLLGKLDPSSEVTVVERNPAGATYGWGVVFSDRTLSEFREADYPTFRAITDRFVSWDAIDIRIGDALIRSGGHVFAGIDRRALLGLLQRRAEELGVVIRYSTDVAPDEELARYDLVVAADGVRSTVRDWFEDVFAPRVRMGKARYVWYGTERVLDSFTFVFRESDHGLFQVHAYPFDATKSTWIVECDEATWRRAGLDEASEAESIRFCEKLFADDLHGRPLLSNASRWIGFPTLRCRTWRHENVVLVGDAAHTAHFSIGSGTKLAMEDAISLARAFEHHGGDLELATTDYELERKPVVERFQEAAEESRAYFERTRHYIDLDPEQFAFHLLSRSGRIDYDELRRRDAAYVDGFDRWFAERSGEARRRATVAPPPIFTPLRLRSRVLRNRLAVCVAASGAGGSPEEETSARALEAAAGGVALVLVGIASVSPEGRITADDAGMWGDDLSGWARLCEEAHAEGAAVGVEIGHAGRRGATRSRSTGLDRGLGDAGWELLAPSPIPYGRRSATPREMTREDMDRVRDAFVASAESAATAGADLLLVNIGHGYLLASFLSQLTNERSDGYGGGLEGRMRFPLEVVDAVRSAWPEDRELGVVLTATDWARGGLEVPDAVEVARALAEHGCDLVEPVAGQTTPEARPRYDPGFLAPYADRIRGEAKVRTIAGGRITTTGRANTIVAGGRADVVVVSPPP